MNRNQYIVLGTLAFLGVYSGLKLVRPTESGVVDLQLAPNSVPVAEQLVGGANDPTFNRVEGGTPTQAVDLTEVAKDSQELGPLAQFSGVLTQGGLWHTVDLSQWQQVQGLARSLEFSLDSVGGIDASDAEQLVELLDRSDSLKVKQTLLVALGVLRAGNPLDLEMYLDEPATAAAAAYALGRRGLPEAEFALNERLLYADRFGRDLTNLDLGLASRGFDRFGDLLQLTRQRLAIDWTGSEVTPLELIRDPRARAALQDLVLSSEPEALRLRALRGWANTFEMARAEDRHGVDTGWVADLALSTDSSSDVRAEALDVLGRCAPEDCQRVLERSLKDGAPEEVVLQVLGKMLQLPREEASLTFLDPLLDSGTPDLRREALRLLAHTGREEAMDMLATQFETLDAEETDEVLAWLQSRAQLTAELEYLPSSNGVPDFAVTDSLAASLEASLAGGQLTEEQELAAMQALLHGPRPELALEGIEEAIAGLDFSDPLAVQRLAQITPGLGRPGEQLVMRAYSESTEFVSRLELLQMLEARSASNPEIERFFEQTVMEDLRGELLDQASAPLAFFRRGAQATNLFGSSVVNLFVRYGTEQDLELLGRLPQAFDSQAERWPAALRDSIRASLEECAVRTADLRAMEAIG